jgi:hypothetical protein
MLCRDWHDSHGQCIFHGTKRMKEDSSILVHNSSNKDQTHWPSMQWVCDLILPRTLESRIHLDDKTTENWIAS